MPAPFDQAALAVGSKIPPLTRSVTRTTVFIFNASYYGTHRFHYDIEAARAEGFTDVVVTANLICSYFEQALRGFTGDTRYLRALEERSIAPAVAGATLTIGGGVTEVERRADGTHFVCELVATDQDGRRISTCRAELDTAGISA
jgi:hydroxyacyl-ACP dehydratase HTD2-like protein with hotdog domain